MQHQCSPACEQEAKDFVLQIENISTRGTRFERPSPRKKRIIRELVKDFGDFIHKARLEVLEDQLATGTLEPLPKVLTDESLLGALENHLRTRASEPLHSILRSHLETLRKEFVSLLPTNTPAWVPSIPICAYHTGDPNPCVVCGPNGHPIIVLDRAFLVTVTRVTRCYCLSLFSAPFQSNRKQS